MFLHIGGRYSVPVKDIALIVDYGGELPGICPNLNPTLKAIRSIDAGDTRRSAVLTPGLVYYSPIEKSTLRKRLQRVLKLSCH